MKRILIAALPLLLVAAPISAEQHYETCMMSAVTEMLPVADDLIGTATCEAACQDNAACVAWTYRPHSFEPSSLPGTCRLLPDIFQTEASDSTYCGEVAR